MDIPLCSCIQKTKERQHNYSDTISTCFCSAMCKIACWIITSPMYRSQAGTEHNVPT